MKVYCENCVYFRTAPYEARVEGCYHEKLMSQRQKVAYLDEQQIPGNHRLLNRKHDCEYYEAESVEVPLWRRLFSA